MATTPQAFGTNRVCVVYNKNVKSLSSPVIVRLPVNHDDMNGLKPAQMWKKDVSCHYQDDWEEGWYPLKTKCSDNMYEKIGKEEMLCCANRLSCFAVG